MVSIVLALLLWFNPMAAIAHGFTQQNTQQTTGSTSPVDITGASIASSNFTAGKKYLLFITAQIGNATGGNRTRIQAVHGSTAFAQSERNWQPSSDDGHRTVWGFMTVWTAVADEAIKLQFSVSGSTGRADQIAMLWVQLSDDLTENTDWIFAERSIDDALSTTFTDGASITFTPGTAGHDWIVLSHAQVDIDTTTTSPISRIDRSGEAASSLPEARVEVGNVANIIDYLLARAFNLGASSNTFKEQAAVNTGNSQTRLHSAIFALNLNKFKNHANAYTEADVSLSATNYATQLQTASITPDVAGDVWLGGYWGFDRQNTGREGEFRLQVDDADEPAGQTTDNYQFNPGVVATDEGPMPIIAMPNLTAAAHTVDLDASVDSATSTPAGQHRSLWAVTMELAAAAPFQQALADTAALTEALLKQAQKVMAEAPSLTEALSLQVQKVLSETVGLVESQSRQTIKNISESLGLTEQESHSLVKLLAVSDDAALSEALSRITGKSISESLGLTEQLRFSVQKAFAETLAPAESLVRQAAKSLAESVAFAEASTLQAQKALAETAILTEALSRVTGKSIGETPSLIEALAASVNRTLSESLGTDEDFTAEIRKAIGEALGLTESLQVQAISGAPVLILGVFLLIEAVDQYRLEEAAEQFALRESEDLYKLVEAA